MTVEHQIASRLATTKEAEALIAGDLRRALEQAFREGQLAAPSATNPYAAPKSKPAWHDAVAVIARWEDPSGDESEPFDGVDTFVNSGDGWWTGGYDNARPAEELHDVTPLIEAKVTDDMVLRALNASTGLDLSRLTSFKRNEVDDMRYALTAALGIEAE